MEYCLTCTRKLQDGKCQVCLDRSKYERKACEKCNIVQLIDKNLMLCNWCYFNIRQITCRKCGRYRREYSYNMGLCSDCYLTRECRNCNLVKIVNSYNLCRDCVIQITNITCPECNTKVENINYGGMCKWCRKISDTKECPGCRRLCYLPDKLLCNSCIKKETHAIDVEFITNNY